MLVFHTIFQTTQTRQPDHIRVTYNPVTKNFRLKGSYKIEIAADPDATTDEAAVLALLQTRDDTVPGTPFVDPRWSPVASASSEDHRIQWVGEIFVLLKRGVEGSGIKVDFEANDYN